MLRIALLGPGRIGRKHAENIAAHHLEASGGIFRAVETGTSPEDGFEDGRLALVLAEAALRSVAEGRAIHVNEIG